ncbi:Sec7-domain-containing protein [Myriangium duriaei CBS 260.36]|uniref:Sec7-domain-containing protein n=1 Tax=Myriangium duriaei CBS 260.36 TaxID=1168546 RepID=A0A9P4IUD8_9PEZI|nr:Sec7-domain-containing protein [Myriangium duriaei CBS 260.36]
MSDGGGDAVQRIVSNGASIPARPITVAIDPIALVITECITVTSAMRKHARWAHSSVSAILGGVAARPSPQERKANHARLGSTGSVTNGDGDGLLAGRWGLRGKKGASMQDNPLLSAFARLRSDLKSCKNIHTFDTPSILQPFMQVIRSSSTTAPITSLALIAITKMLTYNVICPENPNFAYGMQLLSSTVTHCRFEAENTATDEVVFLRILKLMEIMITGPAGETLGDQSVCEMMECGLSLCCHLRTTEVLRRSAEISMVTMCQTIFQRLRTLDLETDGEISDPPEASKEELDALKIDSTVDDTAVGGQQQLENSVLSLDTGEAVSARPSTDIRQDAQIEALKSEDVEESTEVRPYSLPSIRELFRVLSDLLDPFDRQHTDTMRVMALRIVNVALEIAGPSIAEQPSLAALAKDSLCRNLFQLVRSENIAILHESLRVAGTLLATCRKVLKLQQELYLSYVVACLHPRVPIPDEPSIDPSLYEGVPQAPRLVKPTPSGNTSGRSTPVPVKDRQRLGMEGGSRKPDARESMVESVGALVRIPSFMVELFVNYDCEIDRSDLCLDMVGLLSRNAFPDSATWSTTNVPPLCLDSLLSYVQFLADRLDDEPITEGYPDPVALAEQRALKKVIIRGASKFNENPKGGIAFLASAGVIDDVENPTSIAKFLRGTTRIDKKVLGEFISKKSSDKILDAFMDLFDFTGQRVDEALRQLLNTFRLPGESQLIERIITEFADKYCSSATPEDVTDRDAVYVLTYAIIMLNTDQHNPNVKSQNRMALTDFSRNLRGVNGGKDFDQTYLQEIYDSIKTREIILPEEHDNKHAFDSAWKELLIKTQTATDLVLCDTNLFDADMFAATWKPVVATLNYVFMSATDDTVFQRVIAGFDQCAQIASKYGLHDCLDHIVVSLSKISSLATEAPPSTALNTEVQAGGKSIMVSKFAVDFGRESKAELATLVLFRIINGHEDALREGWKPVLRIIVNLFINSLISNSMNSVSRAFDLSPIPLQSPTHIITRQERSNDIGLFSAFTSYVSSVMNDEPPEPNEQEIEATLLTVDCINACQVDEVLGHIGTLSVETLQALMEAIIELVPEDATPRVITVKPEVPAPTPIRPNGTKPPGSASVYDPLFVCLAELSTLLAIRDADTVRTLGKQVADLLQSAVRDSDRLHPLAVSRLSYYLLSLLRASNDHDFLRAPVVLHHISSLKQDVLKQSAQHVLKGIFECINGPRGLRNEVTASPDFWTLLHNLRAFPDGAPLAFRTIDDIIGGSSPAITADNFEPAVALLNAFANAGAEMVMKEQKQGQQQPSRRGRQQQIPPPSPLLEKPARSDVVVRGVRSMTLIQPLINKVPVLVEQSHLETSQAWQAYWQPILRVVSMQCLNPCRDIRQAAFSSLQRCLFAPGLASEKHMEWTAIFRNVLFPLVKELLNTETLTIDPTAAVEMRIQTAQLVCKTFLHYLTLLYSNWDGIVPLWRDILAAVERLMKSARGPGAAELVPTRESLKNVLLVMASSDILLAPPPQLAADAPAVVDDRTDTQKQLWDATTEILGRFAPELIKDVFDNPLQQLPLSPRPGGGRSPRPEGGLGLEGSLKGDVGSEQKGTESGIVEEKENRAVEQRERERENEKVEEVQGLGVTSGEVD